ncbi:hypothetical protein [Falsiroseomonas sp. CW058]|uniref:hypothetical protein n=1 Tax=Falsiroseomonas sp. CW058 TaxID=3388664 RepID=UPI003D31D8DA
MNMNNFPLGVATHVADVPGYRGSASLYRLAPPLEGHEHVVVSAAVVLFVGPETVVVPADTSGCVLHATRLPGSTEGTLSHADALFMAGYRIQ